LWMKRLLALPFQFFVYKFCYKESRVIID